MNAPADNQSTDRDEAARLAAQKQRNVWLGLALFGLVILVAVISGLRLAENIQRAAGG